MRKASQTDGKFLKARWCGVNSDLCSVSPFGFTTTGAADFRGATADGRSFENATFENVDFSYSNLTRARFIACRFENCAFKNANLVRLYVKKCEYTDCDFSGADFRRALLGVFGTTMRRCVFDGVKTAECSPVNLIFENCSFQGRDWRRIRFWAAGFWNCSFVGDVDAVEFNGHGLLYPYINWLGSPLRSGLHDVSFENARLRFVGCKDGCTIENVQMPVDGSSFIGDVAGLVSLEGQLTSQPRLLDGIREYFQVKHLKSQTKQIVNRDDLEILNTPKLADELYELMRTRTAIRPS
ncbi:MAG: pentapeptide repeat-containing protein [Hyphomicrobiaceae bacterium]